MKNMKSIILIFILFSFLILSNSYGHMETTRKGIFEEQEGIRIIKNTNEPLFGEIEFELKEDLSIGNEEDDNYYFYKGIDFDVDTEGNIYVFDRANLRIQKFDKHGKFLQTIGRRGQGPGEFQDIVSELSVDLAGNIYVKSRRLIHVFNKEGEFVKSIPLYTNIARFGIFGNEVILASAFSQTEKGTIYEIALLDSKGEKVKTLTSVLKPRVLLNIQSKKPVVFSFSHAYEQRICSCILDENSGIYGNSSEYKLFVINSSGDTVYAIEKEELAQKITKQEKKIPIDRLKESYKEQGVEIPKKELEKLANLIDTRPFFNEILADDYSRIYVKRVGSILMKEKKVKYDLFNKDGYYLYRVNIPYVIPSTKGLPGGSPKFIKNGYIYRWERDRETGLDLIKRYKIRNWEQIKSKS